MSRSPQECFPQAEEPAVKVSQYRMTSVSISELTDMGSVARRVNPGGQCLVNASENRHWVVRIHRNCTE